jgi:transposase InsO family protein
VIREHFVSEAALKIVLELRREHPGYGLRKLHRSLLAHSLSIGRDRLRNLLKVNGLLHKVKARLYVRTTHSRHPFSLFPNALKSLVITGPEQVWVSDTTCLSIDRRHYFLAVVTDAYSRKIMGWSLGERNTSELACTALEQALASREYPERELIHHSDRGIQYCANAYRNLLRRAGLKISCTETGDPRENAIAERVFRTLKHEYGLRNPIRNLASALRLILSIVARYNGSRMHAACGYRTPQYQHSSPTLRV